MDCGLLNLHNTCWLNTLIQCYSRTPLFQWLDNHAFLLFQSKTPVAFLTNELLRHMKTKRCISLAVLQRFLRGVAGHLPEYIELGEHHDIAEISAWLLDVIYREIASSTDFASFAKTVSCASFAKTANPSLPDTVLNKKALKEWAQFHKKDTIAQWEWAKHYEGLTVHQIQCLKCQRCFHNFEPFQCIALEPSSTLETAFERYFRPEVVYDWTCDDCKIKTPAQRLVRFWKAPETLVIQLKRFNGLQKLNTPVTFPLDFTFLHDTELCFPPHTRHDTPYDLIAVGNHHGTLQYGHYTTHCRSWESKQWVYIDDDQITPILPTSSPWWENNQTAYMLFYVRRNSAN